MCSLVPQKSIPKTLKAFARWELNSWKLKINYKYFGENPVGTEPCDPPVSGESLDHPGCYEAHMTRYCGFDPLQQQWIFVIFLAFSFT